MLSLPFLFLPLIYEHYHFMTVLTFSFTFSVSSFQLQSQTSTFFICFSAPLYQIIVNKALKMGLGVGIYSHKA